MTIALLELRRTVNFALLGLFGCLLACLLSSPLFAQNTTYHVHAEKTGPLGMPVLRTANPDSASTYFESGNLKGVSAPVLQSYFQRFVSVAPTTAGTIAAGSTISFSVWMNKTGNYGVVYPYLKIWIYGNNDPLTGGLVPLCNVTGSTPLSTTLQKFNLACVTTAAAAVNSTQAFRLDVGDYVATGPGNKNTSVRVYVEGTVNGNYDSTVAIPQPLSPAITSLSPNSGSIGTPVTINGSRFGSTQSASTVKFGSQTASPTGWSDTSIQVTVPAGAATGSVVVTVGGVASNGLTFIVAPPNITNISPASGNSGTVVTLTGTGFGFTQGASTVKLGSMIITPSSWNNTGIQWTVPVNAASGSVVVTVNGVASNGVTFTVPPPNITNISPASGNAGAVVTVTGTGFGGIQGTSTVKLGNLVLSPSSWSNTGIQMTIPANATSGSVVVTVNGVASNGVSFTVLPPVITNLSPASGGVGTYVALTGTGFGVQSGVSGTSVTFNGAIANPIAWSDSNILVSVPGATTGPVVVTFASQPSNGVPFTVLTSGTVTGIVRRASDNTTVSGVPVKAFQSGIEKGAGMSAADGSYALAGLPHGIYDVAVIPTGYIPATNTGIILVDGQTTAVDFTLVAPVIDQVVPSSGPLGTAVTIRGSNFGITQGSSVLMFNGVVAVPGTWSDTVMTVTVPAGATTGPVVITEAGVDSNGTTFTVGTGGFSGSVTQAGSGTTIVDALVELLQNNAVKASAGTASDGTYSVTNLNPGTYDLRFSRSGFGTILSVGNSVAAGENVTVNAALPIPGGMTGRVTRTDGTTAIPGATVTLSIGSVVTSTAITDTSGNYAVAFLSPGTYTVTAAASGYTAKSMNGISVTAGNNATSNISLAGQSVITYTYDNLGRIKTVSDSLGGAATYNYDAVGNLLSITNP